MFPCCRPQSCPAAQTQRTCPACVRISRISAGLAERLVARAVTLVRGHPNAHERHYACATAAGMHAGRIQCSKVRVALRPGILVRVGHSDHAQHTCAHGMHGGKLAHRKTPRRHRSTHATWLHADTIKHAGAHQRTGCSLAAVCMGTVHAHCTGPNDHHDPKQRASTSALGAAMSLRTGLGVFVLGFTARQLVLFPCPND